MVTNAPMWMCDEGKTPNLKRIKPYKNAYLIKRLRLYHAITHLSPYTHTQLLRLCQLATAEPSGFAVRAYFLSSFVCIVCICTCCCCGGGDSICCIDCICCICCIC